MGDHPFVAQADTARVGFCDYHLDVVDREARENWSPLITTYLSFSKPSKAKKRMADSTFGDDDDT